MNFDFSDEQKLLKDQARKFLTEKFGVGTARTVLEGDAPYSKDLWSDVAAMGWLGTTIPEAYGGLGLGYLELCVIAEELGRVLAPIPFSSSVFLAGEAIMLAGSEEQKQLYLPKLASGELIGTFAISEAAGPPTPDKLTCTFDAGKLTGTKSPVPDGDVADFAIVVAKGEGSSEAKLALVDLSAPGISRRSVKTVDPSRSHGELKFDGAMAEPLGTHEMGWSNARQILDRAAIPMAFEQVGLADTCLEMAKAYALDRYAFGRQIGSYQAVKHRLADMYVKTELARSNAYYGAWALSTGAPELPLAAAGARVAAIQASHFAAKENIQVHGGMGFTWEADCHLFYRRSKMLNLTLGSERVWKERLVAQLEQRNTA